MTVKLFVGAFASAAAGALLFWAGYFWLGYPCCVAGGMFALAADATTR